MDVIKEKKTDKVLLEQYCNPENAPRVAFWEDRHNCVNKLDITHLKFHPDTQLYKVSDMPFKCSVFRCPHKSWVRKNLTFFSFPTGPKLKQKSVAALKARTMDYKWQSNHRVCSAHFPGGRRYGTNNNPAVFPQKDKRTGQIVWPIDMSYLLNAEATEATVSSSNKTENADVVCSSWEQVKSEARDQQSEDTRRESVAKNDSHSKEIFTIQYPVPLFSLCTKSLIAVLKDAKQLSEENGGGPFC